MVRFGVAGDRYQASPVEKEEEEKNKAPDRRQIHGQKIEFSLQPMRIKSIGFYDRVSTAFSATLY